MTPEQCRAARALLNWSATTLGKKVNVGRNVVSRFENGSPNTRHGTVVAMQKVMEAAGVVFIPENGGGPGVRLRR